MSKDTSKICSDGESTMIAVTSPTLEVMRKFSATAKLLKLGTNVPKGEHDRRLQRFHQVGLVRHFAALK